VAAVIGAPGGGDPGTIPTMVLTERPGVIVARAALGLTVYLDEPLVWAREGARAVLAAFLERIPLPELRYFETSARPGYRPITGGDMATLLRDLSLPPGRATVRHLLWVRIVDDPGAPLLAFSYREVDSALSPRSGYLELTFPPTFDSEVLATFLGQIAGQWPHLSATAGFMVSWNPRLAATAMHGAYPWCRRYLGLDLHDTDSTAWYAPRALPATSWLTSIGRRLAGDLELDLAALEQRRWTNAVQVAALAHGVVVRAGERPTLGDLNQLSYPSAHAEVARALAPHVMQHPPPFFGDAWQEEPDLTLRWWRRFVAPDGWR
jgi:hypothetical protein